MQSLRGDLCEGGIMVKYQYFSHQVFHIAENYLEAAERCLERHPEEGSDAFNALLWPSEHCAICPSSEFLAPQAA